MLYFLYKQYVKVVLISLSPLMQSDNMINSMR